MITQQAATGTAQRMSVPPNSMERGTEVGWIYIAKGIASAQVVWCHVAQQTETDLGSLPVPFKFLLTLTHSYNISCFFFLSGLVAHKLLKRTPSRFAANVVRRIIYPYVLWTMLTALWLSHTGPVENRVPFLRLLRQYLIDPFYQYWFLYPLFVFVCLFYVVGRWRIGQVALVLIGLGLSLTTIDTGAKVLDWIFDNWLFYFLGAMMGPTVLRHPLRVKPVDVVGFLGAVSVLTLLFPDTPSPILKLVIRGLGTMTMILGARAIERAGGSRWLEMIGRHSLEIFLVQSFPLNVARGVLIKRLAVTNVVVNLVVRMSAGIIGPLALSYLAMRYHFSFIFKLRDERKTDSSLGLDSTGEISFTMTKADLPIGDRVRDGMESAGLAT